MWNTWLTVTHFTDTVVLKDDYSIRYQMCLVVLALLHYILCFAVNNHVRLTCIPHGCICTVICCYWYVFTYFVAYLHGHMHIAAGICVLACLIYFLSFCLFCLFIYFFVYLLFVILRWYFLIVHIMYNTAIALIKYKYYGIDRCPT